MIKRTLCTLILCAASAASSVADSPVDSIFQSGVEHYRLGDYEGALPPFRQVYDAFRADSTVSTQKVIYAGMWVGSCLWKTGREEELFDDPVASIYYYCAPVDYRLMAEADSLSTLGKALFADYRSEEAVQVFQQRAKVLERVLDPNHIWVQNNRSILGDFYSAMAKDTEEKITQNYNEIGREDYEAAIHREDSLYRLSTRMLEEYLANTEPVHQYNYAFFDDDFTTLADNYMALKRLEEDRDKVNKFNHPAMMNYEADSTAEARYKDVVNDSELLRFVEAVTEGDFGNTESRWGDKAVNLRRHQAGRYLEFGDTLGWLRGQYLLGGLLTRVGRHAEAIEAYRHMTDHGFLSDFAMDMIGSCYYELKDYPAAIEVSEQILTNPDTHYIATIQAFRILQSLYSMEGDISRYGDALVSAYATICKETPLTAESVSQHMSDHYLAGKVFLRMFNHTGNRRYLEQATSIFEQCAALASDEFQNQYDLMLAQCYLAASDLSRFDSLLRKIFERDKELVLGSFRYAVKEQRERIWRNYYDKYMTWLNAYTILGDEIDSPLGYDIILFTKGLLLQSDALFQNRLNRYAAAHPEAEFDFTGDPYKEREVLLALNEDGYNDVLNVSYKAVQQHLNPGDVAVEFYSVANDDGERYYAYVLQSGSSFPTRIPLFKSADLEDIDVEDIYESMAFSALVWRPLEPFLKDAVNIYFSPASELYNVAIENLPHYAADGLMSDYHNLYRLSSTRELVTALEESSGTSASLFGGLDYDAGVETLERDAAEHPARRRSVEHAAVDSLHLRNGVDLLPGTMLEVENIGAALAQADRQTDVHTGTVGTEGAFKDLSGAGPNLIHIATHGFYWTEHEAQRAKDLRFLEAASDNDAEDRALTRSGLLFAGANNALEGKPLPPDIDDGILTAMEVARMDLSGAEIVVLSACQTGLGEIRGDGVFGLQRGFKKAGVRSLLMSLWEVDDRATQMLMTEFYRAYLTGLSKHSALREAQRAVRARYPAPQFWAAFVLLDAVR